MAAYATASDLAARWRPLSPSEAEIATTLLQDAADIIQAAVLDAPAASSAPAVFRIVSCNMVRRAMESHGDALGFAPEEMTQPAVWTELTPAGSLRLYPSELSMLEAATDDGAGLIFSKRATRYV